LIKLDAWTRRPGRAHELERAKLGREQLFPAQGEAITTEARRILIEEELAGRLPKTPKVSRVAVLDITDRLRRPFDPNSDIENAWYAEWLAHWKFFAIPDSDVRERALRLAIDSEIGNRSL
jgi:hypothetical protein